jgi:putative hydrolase of the HAD superfamily
MVLLLDLDNTLVDSEEAYRVSLSAVGIDPAGADYRLARTRVKDRLGGTHVCARNRLLYFKEWAERLSQSSPAGILQVMDRYEKALEAEIVAQWRLLGRDRLLETLTAAGPAAIVTNENTRTQLLKLRGMDPGARFFRWVVTSEEVGVEKPAARLFEEALDRIGCRPRDCVMVGDSLNEDVLPAIRLGMRAVLTREFSREPGDPPAGVPILARLDDLPAVLAG